MVAAAFIQADDDPEPEVMINCATLAASATEPSLLPGDETALGAPSGLFLCDVDWDNQRLISRRRFLGLPSLHLESGDFDGNGLQDLAADGSEALIMFGQTR
jgi:hypothetical protein